LQNSIQNYGGKGVVVARVSFLPELFWLLMLNCGGGGGIAVE